MYLLLFLFFLSKNILSFELPNLLHIDSLEIPEGTKFVEFEETLKKIAEKKAQATAIQVTAPIADQTSKPNPTLSRTTKVKRSKKREEYKQLIAKKIERKSKYKKFMKTRNPNPAKNYTPKEWKSLGDNKYLHIICNMIISTDSNRLRHENYFCPMKREVKKKKRTLKSSN